ncbi:MAG: ferredoxin [Desulfitobacteriia bacterium]|jgi:ferredoxin
MRAYIDKEKCSGCGLCEDICPDVFKPDEDGFYKAIDEEIPEDVLEDALEAKDSCPTECITIE